MARKYSLDEVREIAFEAASAAGARENPTSHGIRQDVEQAIRNRTRDDNGGRLVLRDWLLFGHLGAVRRLSKLPCTCATSTDCPRHGRAKSV